jgi:hypothetical protein
MSIIRDPKKLFEGSKRGEFAKDEVYPSLIV